MSLNIPKLPYAHLSFENSPTEMLKKLKNFVGENLNSIYDRLELGMVDKLTQLEGYSKSEKPELQKLGNVINDININIWMKKLKENLKLEYRKDVNKYLWVLLTTWENYFIFSGISDYYTGEVRMRSNRNGYLSPENYWIKHWKRIMNDDVKLSYENLVYDCPTCTTFDPTLMLYFLNEYFGDKYIKILDPSAGWGDRLIAAIARGNCEYFGVDPNSQLKTGYQRIIDELAEDKEKFGFEIAPFEDVKLTQTYDCVFTSPPYFDLEEYSDESTQSIKRYSDSKTWVNKFYRPYLMKCWNYLASGGYMGIYISPIRGLNLEQITIDTLSIMKQAKYLGKGGYIAHIRDVKIRSLIVFQKN